MNDDTYLIEKVLQGEQDAFDALVRKYQDAVYGLAFHLVGDFADAQDITQQAFIKAYLKLNQLKDQSKFVHWLKRITVHECIIWIRKQKSIYQLHEHIEINSDAVPTPDQEYESKELSIAVNEAMRLLSEKNRLAVTMYYIDGLSQAEIGNFLGVPATVVANRISRARKQLKEKTMGLIEDTFKSNKLPDDFIQKVRDIIEKGKSYMHRGNMGEALNYSDEALNAIKDMPETPDVMMLKKDALFLKGQSVRSLGAEEMLKYDEQALELIERLGDKREYAGALVHMAYDYFRMRQYEKVNEYRKKALKICEEIGYIGLQAEIMMNMAYDKLCNESAENALEYYQKALELCKKAEETDYLSVCQAGISLINEVGISPGIEKLIDLKIIADVIEKTSEGLIFLRQPGFCVSRRSYIWEEAFRAELIVSIKNGQTIIDNNPEVRSKHTTEGFSFTFKPLIATRTIESNSESVEVIAGEFENCLKIKSVTKPSDDDDSSEHNKKLNQLFSGTKQIWFAPGVGPVKFIFDTGDDVHIHIELAEYEIKESQKSDYFPLSVGNKWTYRSCGIDERYVNKIYYEVAGSKGNIYYLDHYAYAYFSGSKEEYDNLAQSKQ